MELRKENAMTYIRVAFQYPPRIVSQWNFGWWWLQFQACVFQYPPRIVSQWNLVRSSDGHTIYHVFQYPPRIVSQWNLMVAPSS